MKITTFNQLPLYTDDIFMRHLDVMSEKDTIVIHNPKDALITSPVLMKSHRSLSEHIDYICKNNIRKAIIVAEDIRFISKCPSLEYLWVLPALGVNNFDYSPVYELPNIKWLRCDTMTGWEGEQVASVDYSRFNKVRRLSIHGYKGHHNVALTQTVISLVFDFGYPNSNDLVNILPSAELRNLAVCQAPIKSLAGIETSKKLRRLKLSNNRKLSDISALDKLSESLACLEIDTCGKISDFSALETLVNLEYLTLKGSNTLPDLSFLMNMPKLRYLHLTMNVVNGDLSLCERLPYVRIQNRKHYSHKDKDFPKCYSDPDEAYSFNEV